MEIDVEQIMQEIRDELKTKNDWVDLPPFESVPIRVQDGGEAAVTDSTQSDFAQEVDAMNRSWELHYAWPLSPNPVRRFVQRVIKRILKFLFLQIMWQQTEFNAHTVRAMNWTKNTVDDLTEQIASAKRTTAEIYDRYSAENRTVDILDAQLSDLVLEIAELQKKITELENRLQKAE